MLHEQRGVLVGREEEGVCGGRDGEEVELGPVGGHRRFLHPRAAAEASLGLIQNVGKFAELLVVDVAVELQAEEELELQLVELLDGEAADTRVELVVVEGVVEELGGQHDAGDKEAVDSATVDEGEAVVEADAADVHQGDDEALDGAGGIEGHPLRILFDGERRHPRREEAREVRDWLEGAGGTVGMDHHVLQAGGQRVDEHFDGGVGERLHLHGRRGEEFENEQV